MSITNGPNLGLMVNGNAGEGHYAQHMALLRGLDGLVMPNVKGYLTNTPPASPADGDCYIIGAAPTGVWAAQGGKVARYSTVAAAWEFYTPKNGWMIGANSAREIYRYTASTWEIFYQEGTWTPIILGDSPAGTGQTYSVQEGTYTRMGRRIDARFRLDITSKGTAGGSAIIGGLPFTASSNYHDGFLSAISGVTYPAGASQVAFRLVPSTTTAYMIASGSGVPANVVDLTNVSATASLFGSAPYHT